MKNSKIIYSINIEDVQNVAEETLHRKLNNEELALIEDNIGRHIDWYDAISSCIHELKYYKQKAKEKAALQV
jgi:hypothetical protein